MQQWLTCSIGPGQFPTEYAVSGVQQNGKAFSLFAPRDSVSPLSDEKGLVRVDVVDKRGDLVLVRLPAQTFENGQHVTVKASDLQAAPPAAKAAS